MELDAELAGCVCAGADEDELGAWIVEEVGRIEVDKAFVVKLALEGRRVFWFARGRQAGAGRGVGVGILDRDNDTGLLTDVELLLRFAGSSGEFKGVRDVRVVFVAGDEVNAFAGGARGRLEAFAAGLCLVALRIEFLVELLGSARDEVNESPGALVLLDVREAFAADYDATEKIFRGGLENGVEALDVGEAVDGGGVKLRAIEKEDVAAFENFGHLGTACEGWE